MSAAKELALVPPKETALQVFQQPNGLEPYLQKIRAEIDSFVPDVTTRKGREEIASIAHRVSRSKTALDGVGKELVAELKEIPKKIDAERKRVRDTLDAWRDEVRAPLNEWERAEADRVARHEAAIAGLADTATEGMSAAEIGARIQALDVCEIGADWEEFEPEAHRVKAASLATLREALAAREKYEAEQAELADLRRKQAEQEQKDREAAIAREAEERARREAEQQAQAEREAAAKREAEAKAAAERRELELKLQAEQSAKRELEAQQRAEQAERDAEAKAQAAAAAERQRQADEQARIEAETKARAQDKAHKARVMGEAKDALMSMNITEELARAIVLKIARREIPNVSITF